MKVLGASTEKLNNLFNMLHKQWDETLAKADPSSLLPRRTGAHSYSITAPLILLDSLHVGGDLYLCIIKDNTETLFSIPLVFTVDGVRRAVAGDGLSQALSQLPNAESSNGNFTINNRYVGAKSGERSIGVDQTEESVVVGEEVIIKYFSQISESSLTSLPKIEALSAAGFIDMPSLLATIQWTHEGSQYLLALMTTYIPGSDDGWTWAVDLAQSFLSSESSIGDSTQFGSELGEILARMHKGFLVHAHHKSDLAAQSGWISSALSDLEIALTLLPGEEGTLLRDLAPTIRSEFNDLKTLGSQDLSLTHGDFHVGQILRTSEGRYLVIDFDGNPVATQQLLSTHQPLIQDLASLLQSIDHVARVVDKRSDFSRTVELEKWIEHAQDNVLHAYQTGMSLTVDRALLRLFQIQQEFREFIYAQRHLPVWLYVPQAAIASLVRKN